MKSHHCAVLVATLALWSGCADSDSDWRGEAFHFAVTGALEGEPLDYEMPGPLTSDRDKLRCTRIYQLPADTPETNLARYVGTEIAAEIELAGQARSLRLTLDRHDLDQTAIGSELTILPLGSAAPADDAACLHWAWHRVGDNLQFATSAVDGVMRLEQLTGIADDDGVLVDHIGTVGATVDSTWPGGEQVQLSFTAPCGENRFEIAPR